MKTNPPVVRTPRPHAQPLKRLCATLMACLMAASLALLPGCDTNTPDTSTPYEKLVSYVEENGDSVDGAIRLEIPYEGAGDADSDGEPTCEIVLDGEELSLEVSTVKEYSGGDLVNELTTSFELPSEEGAETRVNHSAVATIYSTPYGSSGSAPLDLSTYAPGTSLEFDELESDIDGASAEEGTFTSDAEDDVDAALTSLSHFLESEEMGFTLADLGIASFEDSGDE